MQIISNFAWNDVLFSAKYKGIKKRRRKAGQIVCFLNKLINSSKKIHKRSFKLIFFFDAP
jgi:hypothetical protein